jgi:sec-independent protein translocase protein TatC
VARPRRIGPEDQLTLVEHLEELRTRLIIVLSVLAVAMTGCYVENVRIYHFLQQPLDNNVKLVTLAPTEAFFNAIMISVYGGLLITLPVISYQIYAFVIPAFAHDTQRSIRPLLIMVPALFLIGVVFGWYIVVPPAIHFLTHFNAEVINYIPRASDYIRFVMLTLLAMGLVFQLPVVMMMLGRVGIVSSSLMRRRWRESIVILASYSGRTEDTLHASRVQDARAGSLCRGWVFGSAARGQESSRRTAASPSQTALTPNLIRTVFDCPRPRNSAATPPRPREWRPAWPLPRRPTARKS